ncbi:NADH-ubiquinone oxidoreductase chain L [Candidatus Terasakiella magnetica]|uniref:NADH-ubiquinone oxidoreductase chain L n=1 Tax=Candidatus Terasakiella magnetica TaxID=1867952 RepID=A0A1C3RCF0_9PROT|nr:Na(+)/H(+) antiporter subunit D [Candidatus Terasakiella magnetica]SCA54956.1 NADH-ubiquinone oxidoreductase chain L [Candidatus Terasakiella magnetica]
MMINSALPPGLILILGALFLPALVGNARKTAMLLLPVITMYFIWGVPDGVQMTVQFLDYTLEPLQGDKLSRLFATIFTLMAFVGGIFALNQKSQIELMSAYAYAGGAVGVALAGDLVTVFVFWEFMAVASTLVIWSARTKESYGASMRYIIVHLFGGVVLMIGIIGQIYHSGSVEFSAMQADSWWTWMLLAGFLINAGAPPFSAWLPDAYPSASWSGSVFLSAFTTKTAVYVLIRSFPGENVLIFVGLYMVFYGIIYALLENDMRRILAYSIINQVGFMVVGIGIGTELSLNGASAHAFAHIIYKALLLMSAGAVMYEINKRKCTDLGGLYKAMPLTMICGTIGALAISGFPLTSGFTTKTMIASAAASEHIGYAWFLLEAASAGVFLHAGIKFPWFVFFQRAPGYVEKHFNAKPKDPPFNMRLAMLIMAGFCIGLGVYPEPLYALLPYAVDYVPYTGTHVVHMLELLLFSGFAFFVLLKMMKRTLTITLDFDWFYRKFFNLLHEEFFVRHGGAAFVAFKKGSLSRLDALVKHVTRHHGPHGILARTWPTGSMVLWVAILLGLYLLVYYM